MLVGELKLSETGEEEGRMAGFAVIGDVVQVTVIRGGAGVRIRGAQEVHKAYGSTQWPT